MTYCNPIEVSTLRNNFQLDVMPEDLLSAVTTSAASPYQERKWPVYADLMTRTDTNLRVIRRCPEVRYISPVHQQSGMDKAAQLTRHCLYRS